MIFALLIIYISIRFEFAFAMGAIAALIHDVLITIGILFVRKSIKYAYHSCVTHDCRIFCK